MNPENNEAKKSYTILGIGEPGKYVINNISDIVGDKALLSIHSFKRSSDLRRETMVYAGQSRALFLVLQPGDRTGDDFITALESFTDKSGIPVYTIANYPFLWEGHVRIGQADQLLKDLIRISHATFRIESHQWFPLKEQLGFHRVVEIVHAVAFRILLSIFDLQEQDIDLRTMECISIDENVEASQQQEGLWIVGRTNHVF